MYLKSIYEEYQNNSIYTKVVLLENFDKIMTFGKGLSNSNKISNAIMSVALNRYAVKLFLKHDFKKNKDDIAKILNNGEFYQLTVKKTDNFNENLIRGLEYLDYKKSVITNVAKHKVNTDIFVDAKFTYDKINKVIYKLNNIIIDNEHMDQYDYYKSQYILLLFSFLEMNHIYNISDFKVLDDYLDQMREPLADNRLDCFLKNAKNYYYHLNPYGESLPTTAIETLIELVDEAKLLMNSIKDEEIIELMNELFEQINEFMEDIYEKDIPHYKRIELLKDSDFTVIADFLKYFISPKRDLEFIKHNKKILNCIDDVKRLESEVKYIRDGN